MSNCIRGQMTNNFYNINIHKYNPNEHTVLSSEVEQPNQGANPYQPQNYSAPVQLEQADMPNGSRLNALDSTILVNEAYQNLEDPNLKTEYQITKIETELKSLDKEIENSKAINDYQKTDILTIRKHVLKERLKSLNEDYGESDVTNKISGEITSIFNKKPKLLLKVVNSCINFMSQKVLPKVSKKYNSGLEIKTALNKLETLNKNVDELVTMQMPYGEADERYDMLSEYINRANVIHFNISKTVGTPTFFDTISSIDKTKFGDGHKNASNFGNMTAKAPHYKMK